MNRNAGTAITATLLLAASLGSAQALASERHDRVVYAPVLDTTPMTRIVEVSTPRQECWEEPVTYVREEGGGRNHAGMLVGGIVGGVIGNRFGGGDGRKVATVAGTLLGAGVGDRLAGGNRPAREHRYTEYEQRCETINETHTEERTIGYRVRYLYDGEEYVTRTERDPGSNIRLRVSMTPDH